jgi:hypothetical protein
VKEDAMHGERIQWHSLLAIVCLLAGTLSSLKLALDSFDRQVDVIFERIRGQDWDPTYTVQDVHCPPALAERERGFVHVTLSGGPLSSFPHVIELDGCRQEVTLTPGEPVELACLVQPGDGAGDSLPVYLSVSGPSGTGSAGGTLSSPRLLCSIPVLHLPIPSWRLAMLAYVAPGALGTLLGAALWLRRGRPSGADEWIATLAGGLLALGMLVSMVLAVAVPPTDEGSRGLGWLFMFGIVMLGLLIAGLLWHLLRWHKAADSAGSAPPKA